MTAQMPAPAKPRVKESVDRFVARVRHNIDVHLETLAQDLVKALQDEATGHVSAERLAAEFGKTVSSDPHDSRFDVLAKLVGAMRLLDEASSLKGILDGLARGAASQADRVAVFLVDGQTIRAFGEFGYTAGPRPADVPADSYGAISRAVTDRQRTTISSGPGTVSSEVPGFMRPAPGKAGVVVPLAVGGNVVALVFADGPDRQASPDAAAWTESVEVLVRHAASRLENVTSIRTVEVLTKPA
jgi:hypothetical protein